ncbi:MAG: hypothetical protein KGN84_17545, partial [Acidobacteriota bacterium]|nr:hypothetical protein [Acidobacteriota bacterium]
WLSTVFLITTLASMGLPMLNNFIGEYLVLQGASMVQFKWAIFASIGVILSACYMLWLYQRVFFGQVSQEVRHHVPDLNLREWACVIPLAVMMVWMGMYSQTFLKPVSEADAKILTGAPVQASLPAPAGTVLTGRLTGGNVHAH